MINGPKFPRQVKTIKMSFPLFNKALLIFSSIFLFPMLVLSFYMEPFGGSLTRMGGYLTNDYRSNTPQEYFTQPLFKEASSIEDYQQYYDVVVWGDSFSDDESKSWLNYFSNGSGLTAIFFNMNHISLDEVINSPIYRQQPPKLFIYQSVERNLIRRNSSCPLDNSPITKQFNMPKINIKPLGIPVRTITRDRNYFVKGLQFTSTVNYLKKVALRSFLGIDKTEVHRFQLSRGGLFSSRENDSLLVTTRDFNLKGVTDEQIETAKCSLLSMQSRIRKTKTTEFIAMFFPDKTTVYSDYLLDKSYTDMSIAKKMENTNGLNVAPLVQTFKQAVKNGVVDLYLPEDTHCGFYAYKMAADSVLNLLDKMNRKSLL